MKKKIFFTFVLLISLTACIGRSQNEHVAQAGCIFEWLRASQGDSVYACLAPEGASMVTPKVLASTFGRLEQQFGSFTSLSPWESPDDSTCFADVEFAKGRLRLQISFNRGDKVTSLRFFAVPLAANDDAQGLPAGCEEESFTVTTGNYTLPGIFTRPKGEGPFPVVVLVHGSGPMDKDETVGPNKPFRDLARNLASLGIATLRYDKRTLVYGAMSAPSPADVTLEEETLLDALSAVEQVRRHASVDSARVYLLGHSLGGMSAPLVAARSPHLAGIVIMAGNARPLQDLIVEQTAYLLSLQHFTEQEAQDTLKPLMDEAKRITQNRFGPGETPFNIPAAYWSYLNRCHPLKSAAALKCPILLLQGERDYQVTLEDFSLWHDALAGRKGVTFKSYPSLNHLFMEGEGKSTPQEYSKLSHVPMYVAGDIAAWIKSTAATPKR